MLGELGFAGSDHLFPVGMRVLVVDHDHTCLELLDNLLRKCFYQVTTSSESMKALEMMRKNRNMFDLIISEVNMPHMDGFKLLQQVRLEEMDLPLIMLSEKGDKEQVMKGVMHGACDYLIKPVRIQELQNIWQHVVRKKINFKDQNKKLQGQKRKEQSYQEEEEEDGEENGQEERSFGKKPRVKWNALLHRKFVAAVNQLGLHKASPKKILALMNVEGLTRENVASHLQKYRLSLKKPTKQDSMVAALCNSNTNTNSDPYLQMGDFCTSSGSTRILSSTLPSSAGLNLRGIISSSAQKAPINESSNLLEDILTSIEINQFQNKTICDVPVPLDEDARGELQCQEGLLGNNNIKANSCYTQQHQNMSSAFNTLCSTLFSPHSTPSIPPQLDEVENFYSDTRMMTNDAFFMQQMDSLQGLIEDNSFVSLDWMT